MTKQPRNPARGARWAAGLWLLAAPFQSAPPLPPSTLPLDLVGVVVNAAAPDRSVCFVRRTYPSPSDAILRSGQSAFDYAEIVEVRLDGVVLRNRALGSFELLPFPKDRPRLKVPPAAPAAPAIATATPSSGPSRVEVPKGTVEHYLKNLPDLLDSAFAAPRLRPGKDGATAIDGFEISRIKQGSIVEQLGIRNGDVVLDVNGEALDSLATVMRLLGRFRDLPEAKLTVLRAGKKTTFVFVRK